MTFHNTQKIAMNDAVIAQPVFTTAPDMSRVREMKNNDRAEAVEFLSVRPVHTVVMTSFINDNGVESKLNRGKFYTYRNAEGRIEGVALIGHATLFETRSDAALKSLAFQARKSETPIHVVMSDGKAAETFWKYYSGGVGEPRLTVTEQLFEINMPFLVQNCKWDIRLAKTEELIPIAEAQAEVAFIECGVDPMQKDLVGFLTRVLRRIERERVYVVFDGDNLVFKADMMAITDAVVYLEGIYVSPEYRGRGVGSGCLSKLSVHLLKQTETVCLLSNIEFVSAHRSFTNAGYKNTDQCMTLFM